jgi:hypothetical protein
MRHDTILIAAFKAIVAFLIASTAFLVLGGTVGCHTPETKALPSVACECTPRRFQSSGDIEAGMKVCVSYCALDKMMEGQ